MIRVVIREPDIPEIEELMRASASWWIRWLGRLYRVLQNLRLSTDSPAARPTGSTLGVLALESGNGRTQPRIRSGHPIEELWVPTWEG